MKVIRKKVDEFPSPVIGNPLDLPLNFCERHCVLVGHCIDGFKLTWESEFMKWCLKWKSWALLGGQMIKTTLIHRIETILPSISKSLFVIHMEYLLTNNCGWCGEGHMKHSVMKPTISDRYHPMFHARYHQLSCYHSICIYGGQWTWK